MAGKYKGFTLIELMIVVAIIAILASIALPAYLNYTNKTRFSEVILAASNLRKTVDLCFQVNNVNDLTQCNSLNKLGVSKASLTVGNFVADVDIDSVGSITATTVSNNGFNSENYILTPSVNSGTLIWQFDASSTCKTKGLC
ncbi:prepilin-type N-terminal cleavage/methylation domain-containing protein [Motilimonas sp. E26]|uniref:pilin n=1 Tax=Motilimonas sp. E26 TaxID=2865674 RepID=UPI00249F4267|nr:prepilin-type N-terminal cleavage/methylation domain-containing protein [Motilimonas sp. E26]MCE0555729.1 prepilin-type N-terminal cleavage/methylation domain-containing protein [Motilimonas sp. E26]